jgi:catechol 2,3-dioxygenase-like lactoylglutathione lyase family enzyme
VEFHRGRLIDHLNITVRDLKASRKFYRAVLEVLEIPIMREGKDYLIADDLVLIKGTPRATHLHLALQARSKEAVERCYAAALKAGGSDKVAPGFREHHPYYYAAEVLDPDGNNIEFVNHGPVSRSADSVVVRPSAAALLKSWF